MIGERFVVGSCFVVQNLVSFLALQKRELVALSKSRVFGYFHYCHYVSTKLAHNVEMAYRWRAYGGPTLCAFWAGKRKQMIW